MRTINNQLIFLLLIPFLFSMSACKQTDKEITSYEFLSALNAALASDVTATINDTAITAMFPNGTDVTALVASFVTTGESVSVGGTIQTSGLTTNDFTNPVTYTVTAQDGTTENYQISANIRPVVSSTSPADGSTDIAVDSGVSVTFSQQIDETTITANSSDITCSGSFQISKDDFSTCVKMSSTTPTASNDNKTFAVSPVSDLTGLSTYKIKISTAVTSTNGSSLAAEYVSTTGFTTLPGSLTGTWNFVDGNASTGINKNNSQDVGGSHMQVFNSKLYITWEESDGSKYQIRVVEWDGDSTWSFVDGDGGIGINKDASQDAYSPQLAVFNSKLYAIWEESDGSKFQIRVTEWDGASTWSFVDGDSATGINKDASQDASLPQLKEFNSKLYATWYESDGSKNQVRVAEWDGASTWSFVDGNGPTGINKDVSQDARFSRLMEFDSKLYAIWQEYYSTADQIRVAEWDGASTWSFIDGDDADGISRDASQFKANAQLIVYNSKLYAIWQEAYGGYYQIRVTEWDGVSTWNFVDGDGNTGINKDTGQQGFNPQLIVYNSELYAMWTEANGSKYQIRAAKWDGVSTWSFVDGDGVNGLNKDFNQNAYSPQIAVFNSRFYASWRESDGTADQVRVAEAETE